MSAIIHRALRCLNQRKSVVAHYHLRFSVWSPHHHICLQKGAQQCFTLNETFSTRATISLKSENPDDVFDKITSEKQITGKTNYDLLTKAAEYLNQRVAPERSLQLLEACTKYLPDKNVSQRLDLFNKIWNILRQNNMIFEQHYAKAIEFHEVNRSPLVKIQPLLDECMASDNPKISEQLVRLFCANGDVKKAEVLLNQMRENKVPITETCYNALILGYSRAKDLQKLGSVFDAMAAANVEASNETYSELVKAYLENGEVEKGEQILTKHGRTLNTDQILKIVKCAADSEFGSTVNQAVSLLPADLLQVKELPPAVRNICTELVYAGCPEKAFLIINAFPKPIFSENQDKDTFAMSFIIDLVLSAQPAIKVIEFCRSLIDSGRNTRALHIACEFALRRNSSPLQYLEALAGFEPLRPHYFWPLFLRSLKQEGEVGVLRILRSMSRLKVELDYETLSFYVLPRLSVTLEDPKQTIQTFEQCGMKTSEFLTPLVAHLIAQQKLDAVFAITRDYQSKLDAEKFVYPLVNLILSTRATKRYRSLTKLISALDSKCQNPTFDFVGKTLTEIALNHKLRNDAGLFRKLITELHAQKIKISPVASEFLSAHLSTFEEFEDLPALRKMLDEMVNKYLTLPSVEYAGSHITHPRNMTLDELECHLIELESKGLNPRGVLRRLLQLCVRDGKLERALEIKKKCDEMKVQASGGMLASTLDMYIKLKMIDEADKCILQMQKTFPGFVIDEHKIVDFAALLIANKRFEEAEKLLVCRADSSRISGGDYISKNVWHLLDTCARVSASSSFGSNKTKEFFQLLKAYRYCYPGNALLGPIIREHLLRNEVREAVLEYKNITVAYKKTPLQFELLALLVSLSNGEQVDRYNISVDEAKELLQLTISATAKVHGATNTNSCLILAVANSGSDAQLRKLLINPEIRLNPEMLIKNCEHLTNAGRIEMLLKLARACRGMGHAVKESEIYNILLNAFVKENNYAGALEFYEKLEAEDDYKISSDFLRTLVNLFKVNNVDIPTNLALRVGHAI